MRSLGQMAGGGWGVVGRLFGWSVRGGGSGSGSVGRLVGWSAGQLVGWSVGRLVGVHFHPVLLVGYLLAWLVLRVSQLVSWLVSWSVRECRRVPGGRHSCVGHLFMLRVCPLSEALGLPHPRCVGGEFHLVQSASAWLRVLDF